ncbi:hypothetical protein DEM27_00040 [Metarhizobium album]|uniref:HTH cro/C1-type domain-containing protein n=1 Tax=Metarhizobium album TaxID=2182425 RepID=A0A2U2DWP8_9HYPH|nr:helix-turn-helix domain-containing protein [Rhizobium album]PWE57642.1 hypothetical protein DEM27_00040 [Rhizobium album]
MKNSIEKIRRSKKMSMEKLGAAIGTDASTINKIEKGRLEPSGSRLQQIAAALSVSIDELIVAPDVSTDSVPRVAQARTTSDVPQIPVMGSAAGSLLEGHFQITDGPVDYIDTPKTLENARGIYALYVDGLSMEPMFRHGEKIVVSEFRPPRVGDAVVVQERRAESGPLLASIGILETRNGEKVILRKLNPVGTITIPGKYVIAIHKVIEYSELLGS